jgi:nascent polypeptide-associated complex subunit alpha
MDMKALAKQLKTKQLSPERVVFEFGGETWTFNNPTLVEANMMGNKVFQVMGSYEVARGEADDLKLIMEKTGCSEAEAKKALEKHGDVAEAIIHIMETQ